MGVRNSIGWGVNRGVGSGVDIDNGIIFEIDDGYNMGSYNLFFDSFNDLNLWVYG